MRLWPGWVPEDHRWFCISPSLLRSASLHALFETLGSVRSIPGMAHIFYRELRYVQLSLEQKTTCLTSVAKAISESGRSDAYQHIVHVKILGGICFQLCLWASEPPNVKLPQLETGQGVSGHHRCAVEV